MSALTRRAMRTISAVRAVAPVASRAVAAARRAPPSRGLFADTLSVRIVDKGRRANPDEPYVIVDATGKAVSPWHDIPLRVAGA
jgi:hypothetical protein